MVSLRWSGQEWLLFIYCGFSPRQPANQFIALKVALVCVLMERMTNADVGDDLRKMKRIFEQLIHAQDAELRKAREEAIGACKL